MSLNNKNFKGLAARQFTARKTTLPQNILAAVRSSFNHPPFHHVMHLVRNRVGVPKDRAWLVPHLLPCPRSVSVRRSRRGPALSAGVRARSGLLSTRWPLGGLAAAPASCALCRSSPPAVFAACGLLRPASAGRAAARRSRLQGCSRVLPDYFT